MRLTKKTFSTSGWSLMNGSSESISSFRKVVHVLKCALYVLMVLGMTAVPKKAATSLLARVVTVLCSELLMRLNSVSDAMAPVTVTAEGNRRTRYEIIGKGARGEVTRTALG
jgi:hypothetical protein